MVAQCLLFVFLVLGAALGVPDRVGAAPYQFTTIEYPGSWATRVFDINNNGDMVGTYDRKRGFVYEDGLFSPLEFDSASIVSPRAINDFGMIVGSYTVRTKCSWEQHGFLYDEGTVTDIDFPSSNRRFRHFEPRTYPLGINNEGIIVGTWDKRGPGKTHSFIFEDGKFGSLTPNERRGLNYYGGINDEGRIAGYASRFGGYFYDGTVFWLINPEYRVFPGDINNLDQVVGYYYGHGDRDAHGFIYDDGEFITIDHPEALSTFITGINDHGRIVGWYDDGFGIQGFAADRIPIPGTVWLLGSSLLSYGLIRRKKKNSSTG